MAQSLSKIIVHLVFSTKNRTPKIDKSIRNELNSYMSGILYDCESSPISVETVADHSADTQSNSTNGMFGIDCVYRALTGHTPFIVADTQGVALGCHPLAFQAGYMRAKALLDPATT
jgi:hypothetical protein